MIRVSEVRQSRVKGHLITDTIHDLLIVKYRVINYYEAVVPPRYENEKRERRSVSRCTDQIRNIMGSFLEKITLV